MTNGERSLRKLIEKFGPLELTPEAPGVYSVVIEQNHGPLPDRFYLVHTETDAISDDAKAYGIPLDDFPDWLYYDQERQDSGKFIVNYELLRCLCLHQPFKMYRELLQLIAAFGAKFHPDYFGMFPVPSMTPWGRTVRHRVVDNGVYRLETDSGQDVLSVSFPIYDTLSKYALALAEVVQDDKADPEDAINWFFRQDDSCVPLYELLKTHPQWARSRVVNRTALLKDIMRHHPSYAAAVHADSNQKDNHLSS